MNDYIIPKVEPVWGPHCATQAHLATYNWCQASTAHFLGELLRCRQGPSTEAYVLVTIISPDKIPICNDSCNKVTHAWQVLSEIFSFGFKSINQGLRTGRGGCLHLLHLPLRVHTGTRPICRRESRATDWCSTHGGGSISYIPPPSIQLAFSCVRYQVHNRSVSLRDAECSQRTTLASGLISSLQSVSLPPFAPDARLSTHVQGQVWFTVLSRVKCCCAPIAAQLSN